MTGFDPEQDQLRFEVLLRGYGRAETEALIATFEAALSSNDPARRSEALRAISEAQLPVVWRGYNRRQVDAFLEHAADLLRPYP